MSLFINEEKHKLVHTIKSLAYGNTASIKGNNDANH
jgi:hypothetical protein